MPAASIGPMMPVLSQSVTASVWIASMAT